MAAKMGGKRIYGETYGCAANQHDFEIIRALAARAGYAWVDSVEQADVLLINTCGVKKPTEDKLLHRISVLHATKKPLIIAGCLPKIDLPAVKAAAPSFAALIDPYTIEKLPEVLQRVELGERGIVELSKGPKPKIGLPHQRLNPFIEIVEISLGCLGSCAYCCVRFARGTLYSYDVREIVKKVEKAVESGAKEIWLTSQDCGAYGRDRGTKLTDLLKKVVEVSGDYRIRVGMMNPHFAADMLDELVEALNHPKIYRFVHIPLQSGSNKVLRDMNRPYTVELFREVVEALREGVEGISIATDIIVGYPTETHKDFEKTVELIRELRPDIVNISKYGPRPGTPASKLKPLNSKEVKKRSTAIAKLCEQIAYQNNQRMVGHREKAFLIELDRFGKNVVARTYNYKPVVIRDHLQLLGVKKEIRVLEAKPFHLLGEILE